MAKKAALVENAETANAGTATVATTPVAAAPAAPAAPKEVGKIQKIIIMHKAGYPNKEIIGAGYNKSTVAIQTSERRKDPAGYDKKHGIAEAEALFSVATYVAPVVEVPVAAAPLAVAPAVAQEVSI